jgi:citrate synthase
MANATDELVKDTQAPAGGIDVTDERTGKSYNLPVADGAIRANDLKKIKTDDPDDPGLLSYDPAFLNTASCRSAITFIDGDKGILRYRGYPIEQLAEKSTFLEVAWLLRHGELPNQSEYDQFEHDITYHTYVHENMRKFLEGFRYDAHPMAMLNSAVAALASFYPSSRNIMDERERNISIIRLLAKVPTIAAFCYRHLKGLPFVYPDNELSYVDNFLSMVARMTEPKYEANPIFSKALEVLFILHADHEQNCSSTAARVVGSSQADPYSVVAAAAAATTEYGSASELPTTRAAVDEQFCS